MKLGDLFLLSDCNSQEWGVHNFPTAVGRLQATQGMPKWGEEEIVAFQLSFCPCFSRTLR